MKKQTCCLFSLVVVGLGSVASADSGGSVAQPDATASSTETPRSILFAASGRIDASHARYDDHWPCNCPGMASLSRDRDFNQRCESHQVPCVDYWSGAKHCYSCTDYPSLGCGFLSIVYAAPYGEYEAYCHLDDEAACRKRKLSRIPAGKDIPIARIGQTCYEGRYLGKFDSAKLCAPHAFSAGCGSFMFSQVHPGWGCRCCKSPPSDDPNQYRPKYKWSEVSRSYNEFPSHHLWNIYESSEDCNPFCNIGHIFNGQVYDTNLVCGTNPH
eukprot:CAMPEP_0119374636 /NCGR_PEP_ID=MMETSP1334-20130426/31854_1 /TAXON_ID=127549 /ORGANISM="Calcidiscus leptoporus, Strain RCC1130" /LENGTH=269 /DNA_ID=CAMNT_0007392747 /DNA_START=29 /DNA_END=838 /DNA_ORIENTATION=-